MTPELWLKELLAVIHRDGGQHTESLGLMRSAYDARQVVLDLRRDLEEAQRELSAIHARTGGAYR